MLKKVLFTIILFYSANSFAQEKTEIQNALLWEISGNNLEQPSYLFGTIHLIPKKDFLFYDIWKEKLNSCKYLILETKLKIGIFKQLILLKKMKLPKDKELSDYMSIKEYSAYQNYFLDSLGISGNRFNFSLKYKPFFSYSVIIDEIISEEKMFYERYLSKQADNNKMKIKGLEKLKYQINLVNNIPIEEQINIFLFDYDKKKQENIKANFLKTVEYYKNQDLKSISNLYDKEKEKDTNFYVNFIKNRNLNWIPIIEKYIHKKPSFIAVGAAHLPGEDGVIKLLKEKGYTLKPIYIKKDQENE